MMSPPLKQRSQTELVDAIRYLSRMLDLSRQDRTERGEINAKVCEKGCDILAWAIGLDNDFGALVQEWVKAHPARPDECISVSGTLPIARSARGQHRAGTRPTSQTKRKTHTWPSKK